jgi:hypothetical protein
MTEVFGFFKKKFNHKLIFEWIDLIGSYSDKDTDLIVDAIEKGNDTHLSFKNTPLKKFWADELVCCVIACTVYHLQKDDNYKKFNFNHLKKTISNMMINKFQFGNKVDDIMEEYTNLLELSKNKKGDVFYFPSLNLIQLISRGNPSESDNDKISNFLTITFVKDLLTMMTNNSLQFLR